MYRSASISRSATALPPAGAGANASRSSSCAIRSRSSLRTPVLRSRIRPTGQRLEVEVVTPQTLDHHEQTPHHDAGRDTFLTPGTHRGQPASWLQSTPTGLGLVRSGGKVRVAAQRPRHPDIRDLARAVGPRRS